MVLDRRDTVVKFVILTGMSGAGKSTALKMMEDIGFYCVDNLPIRADRKIRGACRILRDSEALQKVAVGIDIRSGQALDEVHEVLDQLKAAREKNFEILFLDAEDSDAGQTVQGNQTKPPACRRRTCGHRASLEERKRLDFLKQRADYIIDTSQTSDQGTPSGDQTRSL